MLKKELPDGWECKCLRDVISYQKGRKPKDLSEHPKGLTYLTAEALRSGKSIQYIPEEDVNDCLLSSEENLLIIWDGSNSGEVFLGKDGVVASTMAKIEVAQNSISEKYLFYYLKSKFELFNGKTTGSSIPHLNKNLFENLEIPLPPLETQRKIVAILEKAEATQRLRAEADALMQDLLQIVFLAMFGDPATNPLGWTIKKLDDVCSEIYRYPTFYGFDYVNSGTPVIRIGNIKLDGYIDPDLTNYVFIEQTISDRFPRTKIELYDILMAVRGDGSTAKRIGLVHSNDLIGANISPNLLRIKADINYLNPFYLFNLLVSESGQKILERYVTRTAKKTITSQNIKGISIPIPPLSLQNKFQKLSLSIINAQNAQDQSNVELSNLFSNTIARAFTGDLIA